jgi:hypothetical protein
MHHVQARREMCTWKCEGKTSVFIWKDNIKINVNIKEFEGVGWIILA